MIGVLLQKKFIEKTLNSNNNKYFKPKIKNLKLYEMPFEKNSGSA